MNDQAEELRKLMKQSVRDTRLDSHPSVIEIAHNDIIMSLLPGTVRAALAVPAVIVVASGKGGVGVSTLCLLAAESLASRQQRVILVDGDLERGDLATMSGVLPHASIDDVLQAKISLEDALQPGPQGTLLLPALWPGDRARQHASSAFAPLVHALQHLGHLTDWIIVDVGRGIASPAWEALWKIADSVSMVTTGDAVAVVDAYAALKQRLQHAPTVTRPAHVEVVVNQARDEMHAKEIQNRLALSCQRFLNIDVADGGWVPLGLDVAGKAVKNDSLDGLRVTCESSVRRWTTGWQQRVVRR